MKPKVPAPKLRTRSLKRTSNPVAAYGFLKFGKPEHMEALLRRGFLFLNTLQYFQGVEDSVGRGDPDENLFRAYGAAVTRIVASIDDRKYEFPAGTGPLKIWNSGTRTPNIYSLIVVSKPGPLTVDGACLGLGESFVLIRKPEVFPRRVEDAAGTVAERLVHGPVEYVSRTHHAGAMGPFRKYEDFAHQNEYRLVIQPRDFTGSLRPIYFEVGSLEDIATLGSTAGFQPTTGGTAP